MISVTCNALICGYAINGWRVVRVTLSLIAAENRVI